MSLNTSELRDFEEGELFLIVGAVGVLVHEVEGSDLKVFEEGAQMPDYCGPCALVGVLDSHYDPYLTSLGNEEFGRVLTLITAFQKQMGTGWQAWATRTRNGMVFVRMLPNSTEDIARLEEPLQTAGKLIIDCRDRIEVVKAPEKA